MATDTNILRPARKIIPTVGQKTGPTMRLGSVTQRFFAEGEEHEAREYKDVVLDVDEAPDASEMEFDSFDEIPRKRRPLLMTAGVLSLVAVGAIAWTTTRGLPRHNQVKAAAEAMVAAPPPSGGPMPTAPAATPEPAAAVNAAAEEPAAAPVAAPAASREKLTIEPIAAQPAAANPVVIPIVVSTHHLDLLPARRSMQLEGAAAAGESDAPARSERTADATMARADDSMRAGAADPSDTTTAPRRARRAPLHGYVWSPEANAMVPAGSVTVPEPSAVAAARDPSLADSPERTVAPSDEPVTAAGTSRTAGASSPSEHTPGPARTDPERAPIIE